MLRDRALGILEELFGSDKTRDEIADELIFTAKYPPEVANRIAYGDLDMRPEAVNERRLDFTKGNDTTYFHGGELASHFVANRLFASPDPYLANTYLPSDTFPMSPDADFYRPFGQVYPLSIDTSDFLRTDARGDSWHSIEKNKILDSQGNVVVRGEDGDYYETDSLGRLAKELGYAGINIENVVDVGGAEPLARRYLYDADLSNYQFPSITDGSDVLIINDPSRVRSRFAAFDPQYKGDNFLGGLGAGALGITALMAPDEAEAGPIDKAFLDLLPESVAARINSGDLDMRPEARAERQADLYPTLTYHGGGDDIYEIDPDRVKYGKTADTGFFMSTSPVNAASYADRAGNVMPLAVDTSGFDVVNAGFNDWNRLVNPDYLIGGDRLATVGDIPIYRGDRDPSRGIFDLDTQREFDIDELARQARKFGSSGLVVQNVSDVGPNYRAFDPAFEAATGLRVGDEGYQQALDNMFADTIVTSDPTRVRSRFAAFDPEYKGSNILGATAAGALGLTALLAPEEAEAGPLDSAKRAIQQGFTNPQYHGSMQDLSEITGDRDGLFFTSPNPEFASDWAGKGQKQQRDGELDAYDRFKPKSEKLYKDMGSPEFGTPEYEEFFRARSDLYMQEQNAFKTVYPLLARTEKTFDPAKNFDDLADLFDEGRLNAPFSAEYPTYADALKGGSYILYENPEVVQHLKSKGYDSMLLRETTGFKEAREGPYTTVAHFYPDRNIRSQYAEFADGYTGPNILGATTAGAVGLGALAASPDAMSEEELIEMFGTIEPREVGLIERAEDAAANFLLNTGFTDNNYRARKMAGSLSNLADFIPVIGDAKGFAEARDAFSEGNYGEAALLGGLGILGLIPLGGDALAAAIKQGMFIGPSSYNNRYWDNVDKFQDMESQGARPRELIEETTLFRGADGKIRTEISDADATFKENPFGPSPLDPDAPLRTTVGEILDHPELYKNYDWLKNMPVYNMAQTDPSLLRSTGGFFDPNNYTLHLNPLAANVDGRNIMLHELQHVIQKTENFAKGGNTESAKEFERLVSEKEGRDLLNMNAFGYRQERADIIAELRDMRPAEILYRMENISQPKQLFNSSLWYEHSDRIRADIGPPPKRGQASLDYAQRAGKALARILRTTGPDAAKYANAQITLDDLGGDEVKRRIRNAEARLKRFDNNPTKSDAVLAADEASRRFDARTGRTDDEAYRHIAGEVEARNTEARSNMTLEERLATPYYQTQDIPNRQQEVYTINDLGQIFTFPERHRKDVLFPRGILGE